MHTAAETDILSRSSVWDWTSGPPERPEERRDAVVAAGVLLDVSRVLSGLLSAVRPRLGARTERVTKLVRYMVRELDLAGAWEFEVAARLSQIGWLTLPTETLDAATRGEPLAEDDWRAVASHPLVARDLLADVQRLHGVREMIARQREPLAVPGETPLPVAQRDRVGLGGQILRVCAEYDALLERGLTPDAAVRQLLTEPDEFDPRLVDLITRFR